MRLAVMQPYFFPYVGYFQLTQAVDRFVFLEDVNFIKKGWIHRNRILMGGEPHPFTVPLQNVSQNRLISEISICQDQTGLQDTSRTLTHAYPRSKYLEKVLGMIETAWLSETINEAAQRSIRLVLEYLGLPGDFHLSSTYPKGDLRGQFRILDLCLKHGAQTYINPSGGIELYDPQVFLDKGITLRFLKPHLKPYPQFRAESFVPGLSIIDLLLNVGPEEARDYLTEYSFL